MSGTNHGRPRGRKGPEPKRFPLVLSEDERRMLAEMAERESRSLTGQIRHLIKQAAALESEAA